MPQKLLEHVFWSVSTVELRRPTKNNDSSVSGSMVPVHTDAIKGIQTMLVAFPCFHCEFHRSGFRSNLIVHVAQILCIFSTCLVLKY